MGSPGSLYLNYIDYRYMVQLTLLSFFFCWWFFCLFCFILKVYRLEIDCSNQKIKGEDALSIQEQLLALVNSIFKMILCSIYWRYFKTKNHWHQNCWYNRKNGYIICVEECLKLINWLNIIFSSPYLHPQWSPCIQNEIKTRVPILEL